MNQSLNQTGTIVRWFVGCFCGIPLLITALIVLVFIIGAIYQAIF